MSTNDPDSDDEGVDEGEAATDAAAASEGGDGSGDADAAVSADEPEAPEAAGTAAGSGAPPATAEPPGDGVRDDEPTPNTALNALIGGVVSMVTAAFLGPFSPVVGGGVAGYLEGGESDDGLKVGAFAGLVALVPLLLLVPIMLFVVPFVGPRGGIAFAFAAVFGLSVLGAFVVGFSALGGVLGAYLKRER